MTGAARPWNCRCEAKPLLRNFQIGRFDFIPNTVSSGRNGRETCRPSSDEWIENRIAGEREEFD
jgi:hypothetical protein